MNQLRAVGIQPPPSDSATNVIFLCFLRLDGRLPPKGRLSERLPFKGYLPVEAARSVNYLKSKSYATHSRHI